MQFSLTAFVPATSGALHLRARRSDLSKSSLCPNEFARSAKCTVSIPSVSSNNSIAERTPRAHVQYPSSSLSSSSSCTAQSADDVLSSVIARAKADVALVGRAVVALALAAALTTGGGSDVLADVPATAPAVGVYDDAGVIPKGNVSLFERAASSIDKKTGYHVHFVMLKGLPFGDTPNDYAQQLASDWGLGDNDVLFVASTKLARAGFFTGANVKQSALTDDIAKSIAEETFAIPAGEERYGGAILDVSNRLIPVLSGETDPGPPVVKNQEVVQTFKTKEETKNDRTKYIKVVGGVLVIAIVAPLIQTYWYVRDD